MRTVLLTSLLLTSAVLVVLARAEDVATLEDDLESLSASNERPRLDTGESMNFTSLLRFRLSISRGDNLKNVR